MFSSPGAARRTGRMGQPIETPKLTVDVIIEMEGGGIVLIERGHPPMGVALPGGFVDVGESVEAAARREVMEETNLTVELLELLYVYSHPNRDPRGHTVSCVFVGRGSGNPRSGDDARRAFVASPGDLPAVFAFDHGRIVADYLEFRKTGQRPRPQ